MKITKLFALVLSLLVIAACNKKGEPPKDVCDGIVPETHVIKIPKGSSRLRGERSVWYDPPVKEIKVCDSVVWENLDLYHHTATSDSGVSPSFGTPYINPNGGKSQPKHFRVAGEYPYHCAPHPWMKAKLVVKPR